MGQLSFAVLGPLRITGPAGPLPLGTPRLRTLLASLLLRANRPVSIADLADRLWDDHQPTDPRGAVQLYIVRLRQALGDRDLIQTDPEGYLIRLDPNQLDLLRFETLLRDVARVSDHRERAKQLAAALKLWHGPACADIASDGLHRHDVAPLHENRLMAEELRIDAELALGEHAAQIPRLRRLVTEHPMRERFTAQLMLALYRSSRQADALQAYRALAATVADELGLDPGPELQKLHQAVLTADPQLLLPDPVAVGDTGSAIEDSRVLPAQLPADSSSFTGRSAELNELLGMTDHADATPTAVTISSIDGMAGVGKTALTVHAAHRLKPAFPDGQLFLDLHGYTDGVPPVQPIDALDQMLRTLGVPGDHIPTGLDERAALYRSVLADRRTLIVLDNANAVNQVQPLLPGQPGSLVLITSRLRLTDLDTTHQLSLDVLPHHDAIALFTRVVGPDRLTSTPPETITEIVELCGRLPLAIRIAAARLRSRPGWTPNHLADQLRTQRIAGLRTSQRSVITSFELSYQHLAPDQQHLFCLLGLHPGPDIDAYAAAALADTAVDTATRLLEDLIDTHLLQGPTPGRYQFHDLLREYASTLPTADEDRTAAFTRLLDHYAHTAVAAARQVYPHETNQRLQPPQTTASPNRSFADPALAEKWLDDELRNLLAAARIHHPAAPGYAVHLSGALSQHLRLRGNYTAATDLHQRALTAAQTSGDQAGEMTALIGLGYIHRTQGQHGPATEVLQRALDLARTTDDHIGEMWVLIDLGSVHYLNDQYRHAGDVLETALDIARACDHRAGEMATLTLLGRLHHVLGRYQQSEDAAAQAVDIALAIQHQVGELNALAALGRAQRAQERLDEAEDTLRQAIKLAHATGDRTREVTTLIGLGRLYDDQHRWVAAAEYLSRAIELAEAIGHRIVTLHALIALGSVYCGREQYAIARETFQQVSQLAPTVGNRNLEFEARYGLGRVDQATGNNDLALTNYTDALTIAIEIDQPPDQARAHHGLAQAHDSLGSHHHAREHWQAALTILTTANLNYTDDPDVTSDIIRAHLTTLEQRA